MAMRSCGRVKRGILSLRGNKLVGGVLEVSQLCCTLVCGRIMPDIYIHIYIYIFEELCQENMMMRDKADASDEEEEDNH